MNKSKYRYKAGDKVLLVNEKQWIKLRNKHLKNLALNKFSVLKNFLILLLKLDMIH